MYHIHQNSLTRQSLTFPDPKLFKTRNNLIDIEVARAGCFNEKSDSFRGLEISIKVESWLADDDAISGPFTRHLFLCSLPGHPGLRGVYVFTSIVTLEKH